MQRNDIDLNLFRVFQVIYRLRSISNSAKELHVSQPTISKALNKLRQLFDDQLFVFTSKEMQPTEFAQKIFASISNGLDILENTIHENRQFNPIEGAHVFRIGMSDYTEIVLLPHLLNYLKKIETSIKIEIEHLPLQRRHLALEDQITDINIHGSITNIYHQNYASAIYQKYLFEDHYVFVIGAQNSELSGQVSLEQLSKLRHAKFGVSRIIDKLLSDQGLKRNVVLQVPHILVLPRIIADSDLIITIPEKLARDYEKQLPLKILEPPKPLPSLKFHMYWHEKNQKSSAHIWLRNLLIEISQRI
jgi:DNA-binding transcriptional LysR family regulator